MTHFSYIRLWNELDESWLVIKLGNAGGSSKDLAI